MNFAEYDAFVAESGHSDAPLEEKVQYATIKLAGETGEVAELVGKSMRAYSKKYAGGAALEVPKLALELGDVLWYVARLAALHGLDLETIATINRDKLRRRAMAAKDPDGELDMARRIIASRAKVRAELAAPAVAPTFEEAWAATGYRYGGDALENVRLGWDLAHAKPVTEIPPADTATRRCRWCLAPDGVLDADGYCSTYCRRNERGGS